jgi:glycosyltransferase involved in cell wall biosynthesis
VRFAVRAARLKASNYTPGPLLGFARDLHRNLKERRALKRSGRIVRSGIVLVSPGGRHGGGGMGTVSRTIAEWFEDTGQASCTVIDPRGTGSVALSPVYTAWGLLRLAGLWLRGTDVLHLQLSERMSFPRKALFMLAGKAMGMRIVVHHHGAEFIPVYESANALYRSVVRLVVRGADTNIVLGKDWLDYLRHNVGLGSSRVELVYNSVADIQPQIEALRRIVRQVRQPMQYLVLANLSPRKGIGEFLQAIAALHRAGRTVSAVIAGGGDVERYRNEAGAMGIGDICRFTGWIGRDDVLNLMASSDALVLPSHHEGLPMSILEALSAGLPVIATPVGAIPEVLSDGLDCLLVSPGDVQSLAAAMKLLADDAALRTTLRRSGRDTYERMFAVENYMRSICDIYGIEELAA